MTFTSNQDVLFDIVTILYTARLVGPWEVVSRSLKIAASYHDNSAL